MSMKMRGRITAAVSSILLAVFLFAGQVFAQDLIYVDLEVTYDQETAREMLDLVNEFRLSDETWYWNSNDSDKIWIEDLDELTYDYNLEGIAMQRAYEIALNFRHQRPDDSSIYSIEYNGVTTSGENIACGSGTKMDTFEEAFIAFKEDDKNYEEQGHRRNMLHESWKAVGMAHVVVGNVHYWVQEFSRSESSNNEYVEPAMDTRTITDIHWNLDYHSLVAFLEQGSAGNYYSVYYGQTLDLPDVNVWYTANPDKCMKKKVTVSGTQYTFISGYLYGGPAPEDRYSVSWESEDESIVTTDGSTYTMVGCGLCKLTCTVTSGEETVTRDIYVNSRKMPLTNEKITIEFDEGPYEYTGEAIEPAVTVMYGDMPLEQGTDYYVKYEDNINAGTATLTVNAPKGNLHYSGTRTFEFRIIGTDIGDAVLTVSPNVSEYTGEEIVPEITVTLPDGTVLDPAKDYSVGYSDNVNAGTCTITVTGKGAFEGTLTDEMTITPRSLNEGGYTVEVNGTYPYTGSGITPELTISFGDMVLEEGVDYDISCEDNVEPGEASFHITFKGNFEGEGDGLFTITPKPAAELTVSDIPDQSYTGESLSPEVEVYDGSSKLTEGEDYVVTYRNSTDVGTATAIIDFTGSRYSGTIEKDFNIVLDIQDAVLTVSPDGSEYTGEEIVPEITVTLPDGTVLDPDTDYDVSYSDNVNAGTCTITVTGKGSYRGTLTDEMTITPKHLYKSDLTVGSIGTYVYTGSQITPEVSVSYDDTALVPDVDFEVSFENNIEPGEATVLITLKGNFEGDLIDTFTIVKKLAEDLTVSDIPDQFYTGKVLTPAVEVYDGSVKLTEGEDYVVTYRNSTAVGTATVIIDFTGSRYSGTVEKTFNIVADAGWKSNAKGWWYINEDGSYPVSTWQKIGGKWYYFNSNGYMATGWKKVDGQWYYLNSNGAMATGWKKVDGKWYYLNSSGAMATGWKKVDGNWYYLESDGTMATGWKKLGGKWYYLKQDGSMVTGVYVIGSKRYKFDSSGAMI